MRYFTNIFALSPLNMFISGLTSNLKKLQSENSLTTRSNKIRVNTTECLKGGKIRLVLKYKYMLTLNVLESVSDRGDRVEVLSTIKYPLVPTSLTTQ